MDFLKKIINFNQYKMIGLISLPILLILYALSRLWFGETQFDWIVTLSFYILFIAVNWRQMIKQWKKGVLYFLGLSLIGFICWTKYFVGKTNANQLFSTILFGIEGNLSASPILTTSLLNFLIICPSIITILMLRLEQSQTLNKKFISPLQNILPSLLIVSGLLGVTIQYHIYEFAQIFLNTKSTDNVDYFAKYYQDPAKITFQTHKKPKNLILIYVESLESTYKNSKLFERNLLSSLTHLTQPNISFGRFTQSSGADWTIGGIVSSLCGLPLKLISIFGRNSFGEHINLFLPGAVCLSDILKQQGYINVFLNGSSLAFAGDGTFFKTHSYTDMQGKEEWLSNGFGPQDMIGWGLPDDLLFQQAKHKLVELMGKKENFNLTILTIDTHGPYGQINKSCYAHGGKNFKDIVECTANEVANFIDYIDRQGWMDQVTIVITGDHLAMQNPLSNKLEKSSKRYIFNMIINQDTIVKNRDTILHVDLFPTILNALGITWSGNHLGLGYSAIAPLKDNLSFSEHFNSIEKIVATRSKTYDALWATPHRNLISSLTK